MRGIEWVVDAHGCEPAALADLTLLRSLFDRLIAELQLTPVGDPAWHVFAGDRRGDRLRDAGRIAPRLPYLP